MDFSKYINALGAGQYTSGGAVLVASVAIIVGLSVLTLVAPKDSIPFINKYPNDWFSSKAQMAFITNADGLIKQGFAKVRQCSTALLPRLIETRRY